MLAQVKAKLNSKRGVSIMLALLLFLVCIFAGAAALTAASSNIGRYDYSRDYQQRYLAVSSAARLLKNQLETGNTAVTAQFRYDGSSSPECIYYYNGGNVSIAGPGENETYKLIWTEIETMIYTAFYNSSTVKSARNFGSGLWSNVNAPKDLPATVKYTITVDDDDVLKNYPVWLEIGYVIDGPDKDQGSISFKLTYEDENGEKYTLDFSVRFSVAVDPPDAANIIKARYEMKTDNIIIGRGD